MSLTLNMLRWQKEDWRNNEEIKDRKGKMVNGLFVKEKDLEV